MSAKVKAKRIIHKYSEEALTEAMKKIRSKKMSIREASREYNVPRGTLQGRIHGRVADGPRKMGPSTFLSSEEEKKLVHWLLSLTKSEFAYKSEDLLQTVKKMLEANPRKTPFKDSKPGRKWYYSFLKRHPNLNLRTQESISKSQTTEGDITKWFRDLQKYMKEQKAEDILEDTSRFFNGDDTSFTMTSMTNEKETLTVFLVLNACEKVLPPMVVLQCLGPPANIINSMPEDWILGRSEIGLMCSETFSEYVTNGLNDWLTKNDVKRPVLFFVDGNKYHISLELNDFCTSNKIILYTLPPKAAFKSLTNCFPGNHSEAIIEESFCPVLNMVLKRKTIVQNAFKKCGLYPFNPYIVDYSKCIQNLLDTVNEINSGSITDQSYLEAERVITPVDYSHCMQNLLEPLKKIDSGTFTGRSYLEENKIITPEDYNSNCAQNIFGTVSEIGSASITNQSYLEAKTVITSIKDELSKINIDYQVVLDIIAKAQHSHLEENKKVPVSIKEEPTDEGAYSFHNNSNLITLNTTSNWSVIDKNHEDFISSIKLEPIYETNNIQSQIIVKVDPSQIVKTEFEPNSNFGSTILPDLTLTDNQRQSIDNE